MSAAHLHFPATERAGEASRAASNSPSFGDAGVGLCHAAGPQPAPRAVLCLTDFSKMASQGRGASGYAQLMPSSHTPTMTASFPDAPLCLL